MISGIAHCVPRRLLERILAVLTAGALSACGPRTLGWVEPVCVSGLAHPILAKLDTGADRSSIDARRVEQVDHSGRPHLRFRVAAADGPLLERPAAGSVRVRRASSPTVERRIVHLELWLAGQRVEAEVSLADREGLDYPLLIGRDVLAGRFFVDSTQSHTAQADCAG